MWHITSPCNVYLSGVLSLFSSCSKNSQLLLTADGQKLNHLLSALLSSLLHSDPTPCESPVSLRHILCFWTSFSPKFPPPACSGLSSHRLFPWRPFPGSSTSPSSKLNSNPWIFPRPLPPFQLPEWILSFPIFPFHVIDTQKSLSCSHGCKCHLLANMCQAQL